MLRAHRQTAIAERSQNIADRALVQFDAEKPFEFIGQIAAAPAHDLVARRVRPLVELVEKGPDPARHKIVRWRRRDLADEMSSTPSLRLRARASTS